MCEANEEIAFAEFERGGGLSSGFRSGHEESPQGLWQSTNAGKDFLFKETRDEPIQLGFAELTEGFLRHRHGDAISFLSGVQLVGEWQREAGDLQAFGKQVCVLFALRFVRELIDVELEQLWDASVRALVPATESIAIDAFIGDAGCVEIKQHFIAGQEVVGASASLEFLQLSENFAIMFQEGEFVCPATSRGGTSWSCLPPWAPARHRG